MEYNKAKSKKNLIAEELIKACVLQMVKFFLGKEASKNLELVPLKNNVFRSWNSDLRSNILVQVIADIKTSPLKVSLSGEWVLIFSTL